MKPLHKFQAKLLEALRDVPEGGYSLEELRVAVGAAHKSQVVHHMEQLEKKGLLKSDPDNPNGYIIFDDPNATEEPFVFLPVLALASAGRGNDNAHHVIDRIPVRSTMIPGKVANSFLAQAEGDSMEPRIYDGDLLIVERVKEGAALPFGRIVVCEEDGEVKVKKLTRSGSSVVLVSLNRTHQPQVVGSPDAFRVHGIVRGVLFSRIQTRDSF